VKAEEEGETVAVTAGATPADINDTGGGGGGGGGGGDGRTPRVASSSSRGGMPFSGSAKSVLRATTVPS
jgi:hypothetical protein